MSILLLTNRTEPSPMTALTPLGWRLRAGITPLPQSCAPPGQHAPPAVGYCQFGGAAVVRVECPAAYHDQFPPLLLKKPPPARLLAAVPIAVSSAGVAKSFTLTELKGPSPA